MPGLELSVLLRPPGCAEIIGDRCVSVCARRIQLEIREAEVGMRAKYTRSLGPYPVPYCCLGLGGLPPFRCSEDLMPKGDGSQPRSLKTWRPGFCRTDLKQGPGRDPWELAFLTSSTPLLPRSESHQIHPSRVTPSPSSSSRVFSLPLTRLVAS